MPALQQGRPRTVADPEDPTLPWREQALCAEAVRTMPALDGAWISEKGEYAETAKRICDQCPVRFQCADTAVNDPQTEGIRAGYAFENGGLTHLDRRNLANEFGLWAKLRKDTRSYR